MSMRVCAGLGCGVLVDKERGRFCPPHQRAANADRDTRHERGYGPAHTRLRARWALRVSAGGVQCARCHLLIEPGSAWALDHSDDRQSYLGPSHKACNDSAGGVKSHA